MTAPNRAARRRYASKPRELESFELDGVAFQPSNAISMLDLMELATHGEEDMTSPAGIAAIATFFQRLLGEDYPRFRQHCADHGTDAETILQILSDVMEDMSGHPSQRPSPSPSGLTTTGRTARVVSLSAGTVTDMPDLTDEQLAAMQAAAEEPLAG